MGWMCSLNSLFPKGCSVGVCKPCSSISSSSEAVLGGDCTGCAWVCVSTVLVLGSGRESSAGTELMLVLLLCGVQKNSWGSGTHSWTRAHTADPGGIPDHVASCQRGRGRRRSNAGMLRAVVVLSKLQLPWWGAAVLGRLSTCPGDGEHHLEGGNEFLALLFSVWLLLPTLNCCLISQVFQLSPCACLIVLVGSSEGQVGRASS